MNYSPAYITSLCSNEVFVFGSNEAGRHSAGAAKTACDKFGATYGQGFGLQGKSFAIPTKDLDIKTLPLNKIKLYVDEFLIFATERPDLVFLVTPVGTGLAGLSAKDIAPLFKRALDIKNIVLPEIFALALTKPSRAKTYMRYDLREDYKQDNN